LNFNPSINEIGEESVLVSSIVCQISSGGLIGRGRAEGLLLQSNVSRQHHEGNNFSAFWVNGLSFELSIEIFGLGPLKVVQTFEKFIIEDSWGQIPSSFVTRSIRMTKSKCVATSDENGDFTIGES
jgi:hypothetical protein